MPAASCIRVLVFAARPRRDGDGRHRACSRRPRRKCIPPCVSVTPRLRVETSFVSASQYPDDLRKERLPRGSPLASRKVIASPLSHDACGQRGVRPLRKSHRDRRVVGRGQPDEDGDRPEAQLIPVFERRPAADLFAADVSSVLAAQIFDADTRGRDDDARVTA